MRLLRTLLVLIQCVPAAAQFSPDDIASPAEVFVRRRTGITIERAKIDGTIEPPDSAFAFPEYRPNSIQYQVRWRAQHEIGRRSWSLSLEEIEIEGGDRRAMWTLQRGSHTDPEDEFGATSFVVGDDREILAIGVVTCSTTLRTACGAYSPVRVAHIVPNNRPQLYDNVRDGRRFPTTVIGDTSYESILLGNLGEKDLELDLTYVGPAAFGMRKGEYRLSRGDTLHLDISFAPPDTGHYVGRLTIRTNDPLEPLHMLQLRGRRSSNYHPKSTGGLPYWICRRRDTSS